jgi:hypothetical protein
LAVVRVHAGGGGVLVVHLIVVDGGWCLLFGQPVKLASRKKADAALAKSCTKSKEGVRAPKPFVLRHQSVSQTVSPLSVSVVRRLSFF